ncbi:threonine--tRNA ligase [Paraconexibacter algicola]|uniref:Threonine--tRNA ligase n=1 Tax=Paraconexibacter algicola TaxID=2133960 RepID=A0A2T4UB55_9ACTN|nr:threonine--tRNA ligase [Paraconexibacter algicola]PTL54106.1 threonine--tRNA ligase [Paraconexibacter algicola]
MKVTLPDGTELDLPEGATGLDAAAAIGPGLARAALAVKQQGEVRDLARPLVPDVPLEIITRSSGQDALDLVRHDTAHVLAAAALELFPGVKISIGPPIEHGFYYDFEFPDGVTLTEADFAALEAKMKEHVKADETFDREEVTVEEAIERYKAQDQPYKVELIEDLITNTGAQTVTLYTNGPFTDLCRGPHMPSTGRIGAFKLQSVAGAYWRGDANRTMLTRVYGTAFFDKKELKAHLERLEQAKARDHRRLGPQLGLFQFSDAAPGSAFWLPAGTTVFNELVALSREMGEPRGYTEVKTPQIYDSELWKTSGHWGKYRENMFVTGSEGREFGVKPMNCPGHAHLFGMQQWSYKDLPVRYSEPGLLHRDELSGALHGLLRVRHFCQDDAHVFCTEEQIQQEIAGCLEFAFETYRVFGFDDVKVELSTRPENRLGSDELWDHAEGALESALRSQGLEYEVNEGDGAFYGPKIDLHLTDSLGRSWQLGTVQVDYQMPERFGLSYVGADNAEHRPVMIHRALMGSYERFIGILIEDTAGELPVWLAPTQALVLPIADRHADTARAVRDELRAAGVRAEVDERTESVGRKIREAELRKVPYMLVVGDREMEEGTVSVRRHREGDEGSEPVAAVAQRIAEITRARSA